MTSEEETLLKEHLLHHEEIKDDEDFEAWYMQRFDNAESEVHYKHTLHVAQTWKRSWEAGFRAGFGYRTSAQKQFAESTEALM